MPKDHVWAKLEISRKLAWTAIGSSVAEGDVAFMAMRVEQQQKIAKKLYRIMTAADYKANVFDDHSVTIASVTRPKVRHRPGKQSNAGPVECVTSLCANIRQQDHYSARQWRLLECQDCRAQLIIQSGSDQPGICPELGNFAKEFKRKEGNMTLGYNHLHMDVLPLQVVALVYIGSMQKFSYMHALFRYQKLRKLWFSRWHIQASATSFLMENNIVLNPSHYGTTEGL